jgi:hypothetical protein
LTSQDFRVIPIAETLHRGRLAKDRPRRRNNDPALGAGPKQGEYVRYLKILAASAVAAAAMMAVVGAGTASAETVLCTGNPPGTVKSEKCAAPHEFTWPAPAKIKAHAIEPELITSLLTVVCSESTTEIEPETDNGATTINGKVTALAFTGCHIKGSTTACTVTIENLPYSGTIQGTVGTAAESKLTVNKPRAKVQCGSFINCTYEQATVSLTGTNGLPTTFAANTSLAHVAGLLCPETSTWKGLYKTDSTITVV